MVTLKIDLTDRELEVLRKIALEFGLSVEDLLKEKVLNILRERESGITPEFLKLLKDKIGKNRSLLQKLA